MTVRNQEERDELHHSMLVYLFDPDEGLKAEIEATLQTYVNHRDNLAHAKQYAAEQRLKGLTPHGEKTLELVSADVEFYTDVWGKIIAATGRQDISQQRSDMNSDVSLHTFLVGCGQRAGNRMETDRMLAADLISRGWRKK